MSDFTTLDRLATSQYGVLTTTQLLKAGFPKHKIRYRVDQGQLRRLSPGVFAMAGVPFSYRMRASAAALAAGPVGAVSHRTAANFYSMRSVDTDIDVSVRYPRRLKIAGAQVHRSRDLVEGDITWVDGIATTTPERTICDLGLIFPEHEVMRILRHAVATGLVTSRDVNRIRIRIGAKGRNGAGITGRCLNLLHDLADQTESGLEAMFLEACRDFHLAEPQLQLPVMANGRSYRLDFAYPVQRVFIELDGQHHGLPSQISADGGRQNDLVAHGWQPVRIDYTALKSNPEHAIGQVRRVLAFCEPKVTNSRTFGSQKG